MILADALTTWACSGVLFWIALLNSITPTGWSPPSSRETGWATLLFFYLPLCLLGGPLWWALFAICRLSKDKP